MVLQLKKWLITKQLKNRKIIPHTSEEIESKHIKELDFYNDSSYFNGIDGKGNFFLSRMSFRFNRPNEHWLEFYTEKWGLLRRIKPLGAEGDDFQQGNLRFERIKPLQKWKITYNGMMMSDAQEHHVCIDLLYEAKTPIIDFQHAMILDTTASAIAQQPWSSGFFNQLKEIKKMHFEQGGMLDGTISVDGVSEEYSFYSMRDHSWGIRRWDDWKRHTWMCGMLENGDCINVSLIKYNFLGQLAAGFYIKSGTVHFLRKFPDFEEFAQNPLFPEEAQLDVEFENNIKIRLNWERKYYVPYDMDNGKYKIYEGISEGRIDNNKVHMVTEFGFNPKQYELKF